LALPLAPADRRRLDDAARARGIPTATLALRVLQMVARDNLADAVLDDRPTPPAKRPHAHAPAPPNGNGHAGGAAIAWPA
jgi:hypothetical protein